MPPKQAINHDISDSSTYPDILPLWSAVNIRMGVPRLCMADDDPHLSEVHGRYDPWYPRMERALRLATRAIISSTPFFLKVLCSNVISMGPVAKAFDPDYTPTEEHHREYRVMLEDLSNNHRLYVNDHGKLNNCTYARSTLSSNRRAYVFWTTLNSWFAHFYARSDFENVPESERRRVDFVLAVTLVHEHSHQVYMWREWKEKLAAERPYVYCSSRFQDYLKSLNSWSEPRFTVRQWKPEIGDAWEDFTLDGTPCFQDSGHPSGLFLPSPSQGLQWGHRTATCSTIQSRSNLAIGEDLNQRRTPGEVTPVLNDELDRFLSRACWDYVEDLLKLDRIISPAQEALVKDVQLMHVLRFPALYNWLLHVPRFDTEAADAYTLLPEELAQLLHIERYAGDPSTRIGTGPSYHSDILAPTSTVRLPRTSAIMDSNSEEVIGSVSKKVSSGKVSKTKRKSARLTGREAKPKSASK